MNRLIIIGNGFDLAHGMKTSYNDFILWYLKKAYGTANQEGQFEDGLLIISKLHHYDRIGELRTIDEVIEHYYHNNLNSLTSSKNLKIPGYSNYTINPFHTTFKSDLLKHLLQCCATCNWVDIENEFYGELKGILHSMSGDKSKMLLELNKSLSVIIENLEDYLQTQKPVKLNEDYARIFRSAIIDDDIVIPIRYPKNKILSQSMMLNFNYTKTPEHYLDEKHFPNPTKIQANYIHGQLGNEKNQLIFGFGDELDDDYLRMENEKIKGFLDYIKSFWYFKTSNYHNLIRFINSNHFQVFIMGHSCGLSDRTMLNMIFEHENCKSIKIYYYQNEETGYNNYTDLTQEISRHFKNKVSMRDKIVPFDRSEAMPQVGK